MNLSLSFTKDNFKKKSIGVLAIFLLGITACSTNPVTGKKDFSLINTDQELAMGAQGHRSIMKTKKTGK